MSCPTFDNLLESLSDDLTLESVRAHVDECSSCRQAIGRVRAVFRLAALYEEFLAGASQKMPSRWARSIAKRVHTAFEAQFAARPTCPSRDELFDWLVGNAGTDPAIGPHLAMCAVCQQAMGEMAALLGGASQWDVVTSPAAPTDDEPMPVELSDRVFKTVNAAYEQRFAVTVGQTAAQPARSLRRVAAVGLAAAAALFLAVGGVVWQLRNPGAPPTEIAADVESREPSVNLPRTNPIAPEIAVTPSGPTATPIAAAVLAPSARWAVTETALVGASQVQASMQPVLNTIRRGIRPPTADDWTRVADQLAARAKQARSRRDFAGEERHLVNASLAARAAGGDPARQAAYGLLLVRNQLDQDRPDAALAAYENLPQTDAAEIRPARSHLAGRLAKTYHDRGRSAIAVIVLSSLGDDLTPADARILADARRAVAIRTTRLVGTGNQALTRKVERWAQSRLADSLAQTTR